MVAYTAESLDVEPNKDGELELECDEVWSLMGSKQNPQWLWLALEKTTRLIVAACIGDRGIETAKKLWRRLPRAWRNQAKFYTDFWQAYREVIPLKQQERVSKGIAKHTKVDMIWVAGRRPTLVSQNLKATTLTYLAIVGKLLILSDLIIP